MKTIQRREILSPVIPAATASSLKVSAVIITYNEEHCIAATLSKLDWCDEIIVVDSYSTDNTVNICREFNCKIFSRSFDGYGPQKQYAVSLARNNWVLAIDADEVLSDALADEIQSHLAADPVAAAFSMPMNLVFLNKEFTRGKESTRSYIRLFNKQKAAFSNAAVHESVQVNGVICYLKNKIRHYSYTSVRECMDKSNRYSTYSATMSYRKGKNKSVAAIVFGLPFNFLKYYILEKNFLNGLKGFYWAAFSTWYHFAKYVKLREMYTSSQAAEMQVMTKKKTA